LGSRVLRLWEAPAALLRQLYSLYLVEPLTHFYAVYDTVYGADRSDGVLVVKGSGLSGYVIAYRGWGGSLFIHAWKAEPEHLARLLGGREGAPARIIVQLHGGSVGHVEGFADTLRGLGYRVEAKTYLDMAVTTRDAFRPRGAPPGAVMREITESNAGDFIGLEEERGTPPGEARELLREAYCIGAYLDRDLASTACVYLRTRDAWLIGNVYTRPRYRRRGLAAALASALTRRALDCRATPILHVEEENRAAARLYHSLGYRVLRARPWLAASR